MSYKVIVDSCGEFTPEMKADGGFEHVALGIQIEDTQWTDDDSLKQEELLLKIAESTSCAKTSVSGKVYGKLSLRCRTYLCGDTIGRIERII